MKKKQSTHPLYQPVHPNLSAAVLAGLALVAIGLFVYISSQKNTPTPNSYPTAITPTVTPAYAGWKTLVPPKDWHLILQYPGYLTVNEQFIQNNDIMLYNPKFPSG